MTAQPFAGDHGDADVVIAQALRSWFAAPAAEQWRREVDVVNALGRDPVITERVQGLRLVIRSAPATMAQ